MVSQFLAGRKHVLDSHQLRTALQIVGQFYPLSARRGVHQFIASVPTTWDETRIAVDYKKQVQQVTPSTQLTLHLVRNGGWCGSFE